MTSTLPQLSTRSSAGRRPRGPCCQFSRSQFQPARTAATNSRHAVVETSSACEDVSKRFITCSLASSLVLSLVGASPARAELKALPQAPPTEVVKLITNADVQSLTGTARQIYGLNRRVQSGNYAPENFPGFIREGFNITIVADGYTEAPSGLIYLDVREGTGNPPVEGQEVVFNYTGYNESAGIIDSTYRRGAPAQTRLGIQGLIPGFEEGIRGMKVGGRRRMVVPPELGPPVGPSTFFSAKQCEVFDVELLAIRTCTRRQLGMFSDVVCE